MDSSQATWNQFALILGLELKSVTERTLSQEALNALHLTSFHFEELLLEISILTGDETVAIKLSRESFRQTFRQSVIVSYSSFSSRRLNFDLSQLTSVLRQLDLRKKSSQASTLN